MNRPNADIEPTGPLRLKARPDLVVARRAGRTPSWYLKDPLSLEYFFLEEHEYQLLRMLDGRTTVTQMRARFETLFPPLRLSWVGERRDGQ